MIAPVGFPNTRINDLRALAQQERVQPVQRYPFNNTRPQAITSSHVNIAQRNSIPVHIGFSRIANTPTHDDIHGTNFGTVTQANEIIDPASRMPTPVREGVIATQAALAYGNPFFVRSRIQEERERNHSLFTAPVSLN
ncbi:MAG: hypothetical protein HYR97_02870 [Candidatus Melainabacteria bacterium]|nr:hypothetical protein [Candidatus Melainabacteria bacterium]